MVEKKSMAFMNSLLCKKWTMQIILSLKSTPEKRFKDIYKELNGISTKTLSDRLKILEKEGIINRKAYSQIPPKVEYSLTEKGIELAKSFRDVEEWAMKWML